MNGIIRSVSVCAGLAIATACSPFGKTSTDSNFQPGLSSSKTNAGGAAAAASTSSAANVYNPIFTLSPTSSSSNASASINRMSGATMATQRSMHTATLLVNRRVLVVGGHRPAPSASVTALSGCELYDPNTNNWSSTASLATARYAHTATLLNDGRVLVAGGRDVAGTAMASTEIYDPSAGTWSAGPVMITARYFHKAILLSNNKVLIAGGSDSASTAVSAAEIFDPAGGGGVGSFTATANLNAARYEFSMTALPDNRILIAGGRAGASLNTSEIFDASGNSGVGTFTLSGNLVTGRRTHGAVLLNNGKVLIAGGYTTGPAGNATAELYDPALGTWASTGNLTVTTYNARHLILLDNGKALYTGGQNGPAGGNATSLYDPGTGTWSATGAMTLGGRYSHTLTKLADGKVLVAGGNGTSANANSSSELYDPTAGTWSAGTTALAARYGVPSILMSSGKVFSAGGTNGAAIATANYFDPSNAGSLVSTASLNTARFVHTSTLLANGTVLIAGGNTGAAALASAEIFDPAGNAGAGAFTLSAGSMSTTRYSHTATLLGNGKVLITGGHDSTTNVFNTCELFDSAAGGSFSATGSMATPRYMHTATLLGNGKVLVAGGYTVNVATPTAASELYNPGTGTWAATTGPLSAVRYAHTATLLGNGKVLVVGGSNGTNELATAELYDPVANTWSATGSMSTARMSHTATLLDSGLVLVAYGTNQGTTNYFSSTELYDPGTGLWTAGPSSSISRYSHTATKLANGIVYISGGTQNAYGGNDEFYSNYPSIQVSATGGTAPYSFTLLTGSGILNPVSGSYCPKMTAESSSVRVTDAAAATDVMSIITN